MARHDEHLTPAEVGAVARGESGQRTREHLAICAECREQVDTWDDWNADDWNAKVRQLRAGDHRAGGEYCPSSEDLASFAAGLDVLGADRIARHVAGCDRCGAVLFDATSDDEADGRMTSTLNTATPDWRKWMAARFLKERVSAAPSNRRPTRWMAIAAGVVVAVAASVVWYEHANNPARLLSQAYTSSRPFEYRLPDAGYGPVREQRSGSVSAFDRPESLQKAETEIQRRLRQDSAGPGLSLLKARAELLEGQYNSAVDDLTRASELASSAEVLADLGTAYALRGDSEHRNGDFGHSMDLLLRALRLDPGNVNALFNLAIVYERVWMLDDAIATWGKFLKIETRGGWNEEARNRLARVEQKKKARQTALDNLTSNPSAFLAVRASSYDAEDMQTIFWSRWLPGLNRDAAASEAARRLAAEWVRQFGDRLLDDAYSQAAAADVGDLLEDVGRVIEDNTHGHNDEVLARLGDLIKQLEAKGQKAAARRMEIELAYSYRRSTSHEPCLATAEKLLGELDGRTYPWLQGRARLERSVCIGRAGGMGPAQKEREEAARDARAHGFAALGLQAEQLVTSIDALSGNSAAVWEMAPQGLGTYWTSAAPEARAQQGLYDMAVASKAMGLKEAAIATQAAAVEALVRWRNPQVEALNRVYLASLLEEAEYRTEAVAELGRAENLFHGLPPGKTVENLIVAGKIRRAEAEAAGPYPQRAIVDLDGLTRLPNFSSLEIRMRGEQARGIALAAENDWFRAEECFRRATNLGSEHVRSFTQPLARTAAAEMALVSRRYLVQIALVREVNAAKALNIWRERWTDLTGLSARVRTVGGAKSVLGLTYVVLPMGVAGFASNGVNVSGKMLAVSPLVLAAEIREFQRLCGSPKSNLEILRADGRRLYAQLIQPLASDARRTARILVESDGWLSSLPFAALVDEDGRYMVERHELGTISDPADADDSPDKGVSRDTKTVIVAAPSGDGRLPYLASAMQEATELAARAKQATLLDASAAEPEMVARQMSAAGLVHFAGHGWSNAGNGALILGGTRAESMRILTATDLASMDWKSCHLAVLSACLTATGEERGPVNPQSLVRALLTAGAKRVVASRWSIDGDSTRAWMSHFYDALFAGKAPVTALRQASIAIASIKLWQHPYYWAAFDLYGAP